MATFDDVRRLCADLPMVEEGTSYGTSALRVDKRLFCRMWSGREHDRDDVRGTEVLVVFCEPEEKESILESSEAVFETPHYHDHGGFLVRLAEVDLDELADHLEHSYRVKAPASALKLLDGE